MKVFEVYAEDTDWDQYDSCVIVAEDVEAVKAMMTHVENGRYSYTAINHNSDDEVHFYDSQGLIYIKEVDLTKAGIVCASFNAG